MELANRLEAAALAFAAASAAYGEAYGTRREAETEAAHCTAAGELFSAAAAFGRSEAERDREMLEAAVARAVAAMAQTGIDGWWLSVPQEIGGSLIQTRPVVGCTDQTCGHHSHDSAVGCYRWIPPEGSSLVCLGYDGSEDTYYVLRRAEGDTFLQLSDVGYFYDAVRIVESSEVPEFLLAALANA